MGIVNMPIAFVTVLPIGFIWGIIRILVLVNFSQEYIIWK